MRSRLRNEGTTDTVTPAHSCKFSYMITRMKSTLFDEANPLLSE